MSTTEHSMMTRRKLSCRLKEREEGDNPLITLEEVDLKGELFALLTIKKTSGRKSLDYQLLTHMIENIKGYDKETLEAIIELYKKDLKIRGYARNDPRYLREMGFPPGFRKSRNQRNTKTKKQRKLRPINSF
jgi:hypothetical protein